MNSDHMTFWIGGWGFILSADSILACSSYSLEGPIIDACQPYEKLVAGGNALGFRAWSEADATLADAGHQEILR